jgi:hypothetical protein
VEDNAKTTGQSEVSSPDLLGNEKEEVEPDVAESTAILG